MTDIPVNTNCKSERCKGAGLCSCTHLYNDGTAVPGSGSINDPYVHEKAAINCVLDPNGVPLPVDGNRCVILPQTAQSVDVNGSSLTPNSLGQIVIPEDFIQEFTFTDSSGSSLAVNDGTIVNLAGDGDASQGYATIDADTPTIVGNNIVFPQIKVIRETRGALLPLPSSNTINLPTPGNSSVLFAAGIPLTKTKATNYTLHVGLGIMQSSVIGNAPGAGEEYVYRLDVIYTSNGTAQNVIPIGSAKSWTPNLGRGYDHNTHSVAFSEPGPPIPSAPTAQINVRITCVSRSLLATRNLIADVDLTLSYI